MRRNKKRELNLKGYVETDEEIYAYWDEQEAYEEKCDKNRSDITDTRHIIYTLIYDNLFPKDDVNPTFTFNEALWKIEWQLRKLQELFPYPLCGTMGLMESQKE